MNAESSRSHLIVGIVIESTNITNGTVHRGKVCCTVYTQVVGRTMDLVQLCVTFNTLTMTLCTTVEHCGFGRL